MPDVANLNGEMCGHLIYGKKMDEYNEKTKSLNNRHQITGYIREKWEGDDRKSLQA